MKDLQELRVGTLQGANRKGYMLALRLRGERIHLVTARTLPDELRQMLEAEVPGSTTANPGVSARSTNPG